MSVIFNFEDVEINNEYGDLEFEACGIEIDHRFDAYNGMGNLQTYGNVQISDFEITYAILTLTDEDGNVLGEKDLDEIEVRNYLEFYSDHIIERLISEEI